ncbi:HIT zinc finger [Striga asiatica]|uniref:HIT zinc finger n=1 Tax=Striga asiatica TaxID=4170 RepID=A0A5A7QX05_STRAF|nr:HIT zinc finger [Striga asiatica]
MDNSGDFGPTDTATSRPMRRRRSNLIHRPLNESEVHQEYRDSISLSSTPSDHVSEEGNNILNQTVNWQKEPGSTLSISMPSYANLAGTDTVQQLYDERDVIEETIDFKRSVEDNNAKADNWTMNKNKMNVLDLNPPVTSSGGTGTGKKFSTVKLKVGGVTHTIQNISDSNGSSVCVTSTTKSTAPDATNPQQKLSSELDQKVSLRGLPWKDFSRTGFSFRKMGSLGVDVIEDSVKLAKKHSRPSISKSNKFLTDELYDEEEDDEIRYLKKLKATRSVSYDSAEYEEENRGKKLRKISKVMERHIPDIDSVKGRKSLRPVRASEDYDYVEEDELVSDGETENKNKKQRKEQIGVVEYSNKSSITTRRKAILTSRDMSLGVHFSSIQFPDGLPPVPPRKPKEQVSEVEQQLKRAEAAQRRRIQNEKAARESEAEAIRKILGQDSSRKRREEKIKRRQEELAQRTANDSAVATNAVRWVMGPSGTVVTFPDEIGLPSIFEPKLCSYPPPREKCAGPTCTNVYKYRDSKSNLPLCSLGCYKAINDKAQPLPTC